MKNLTLGFLPKLLESPGLQLSHGTPCMGDAIGIGKIGKQVFEPVR